MDIDALFEFAESAGEDCEDTSLAAAILLREQRERANDSATWTPATVVVQNVAPPPVAKKRKTPTPKTTQSTLKPVATAAAPPPPAGSSAALVEAAAAGVVLPPMLKTYLSSAGGMHKGEDAVLFRATYANAAELGAVLYSLAGVLTDYELYFDARTGLTVVGMNAVNTIYIAVDVPAASFLVFNLADDKSGKMPTTARFSVSARQFFALRSEFTSDYTLTLCALLGSKIAASEELYLQLHPAFAANAKAPDGVFAVPQFDGEHEVLRDIDPAALYQFRVVVRTAQFKDLIGKWARYGDTAFRLANHGLDIMGFDGDTKTSGQVCVNYTDTTKKDTVLSGYKCFHGDADAPEARTVVGEQERAVLDTLTAAGSKVMLCHLDRLVRRTTNCAHMDCLLDEPPLDEATGAPTREPRPTCRRDEATAARLAQIDSVRFRTKFLTQALATLAGNSEFIELFFGRKRPPEDDEFYPMLMRGRVLNATRDRVLISRSVYVCVCLNEK